MKLGSVSHGSGRIVVATLSGSAAEAAGLRIGDVVLAVDGTPAAKLGGGSLKGYLRGPVGSAVDLEVHRVTSVCPATLGITVQLCPHGLLYRLQWCTEGIRERGTSCWIILGPSSAATTQDNLQSCFHTCNESGDWRR